MRIGIVEFLYHQIFLLTLIRIFRKLGFQLEVFTTRAIKEQVIFYLNEEEKNGIVWYFSDVFSSRRVFFKFINRRSAKFDVIFYNTLQGRTSYHYWDYFRFIWPRCKSILVAGRTTESFESPIKMAFSSHQPSFKRRVGIFLNQWMRIIMRMRFDGMVVHTESYLKYGKSYNYNKPMFIIPFALKEDKENAKEIKTDGNIRFVISGGVSDVRRDYKTVLQAFEQLESKYFKKISLILLGRAQSDYARDIIRLSNDLNDKGVCIKYFTDWVPESVWHKTLLNSEVCICPVRLETHRYGGYTSGVCDAIRYGKPLICVEGYEILSDLKSSTSFYNNADELRRVLQDNFFENPSRYAALSKIARANSEKFSVDIWAKKVLSALAE